MTSAGKRVLFGRLSCASLSGIITSLHAKPLRADAGRRESHALADVYTDIINFVLWLLGAAGGVFVVVSGVSKFAGDLWRDRRSDERRRRTEIELEGVRQVNRIRAVQAEKFAGTRYDVYFELWKNLQALQTAVNNLRDNVTITNIESLLRQLRTTGKEVGEWSIFFEDEHLREVRRLFTVIESFRTGKLELREIRSTYALANFVRVEEIEAQVWENRFYKERWEQLLDNLTRTFRDRLSAGNKAGAP